jgi:hypothetical protein
MVYDLIKGSIPMTDVTITASESEAVEAVSGPPASDIGQGVDSSLTAAVAELAEKVPPSPVNVWASYWKPACQSSREPLPDYLSVGGPYSPAVPAGTDALPVPTNRAGPAPSPPGTQR